MITTIDGHEYNTESAECVLHLHANEGKPWWLDERLYLTEDGRWLFHGRGGPVTIFPQTPNGLLRPMTPDQAKEWLERHDHLDLVRKYFPETPPRALRAETTGREIRMLLGLPEYG